MGTMNWEGTFPGDFQIPRPLPLGTLSQTLRMCGSLLPAFLISHEKDPFVVEVPAPWWCAGTELGPAGQEEERKTSRDKEREHKEADVWDPRG